MKSQPFLFIAPKLSRGLITLAVSMQKKGMRVIIASPAKHAQTYKLRTRHVRIGHIRLFNKVFLFSTSELRKLIKSEKPRILVIEQSGKDLARRMRLNHKDVPPEFGIDLSVFNPKSVASLLQSRFLSEFNIAPHQKLVTVISPLGLGLDTLLKALAHINSDELLVALYGSTGSMRARKIIRQISRAGQNHRITFIGQDEDLATIMRSSYAVMSLCWHDRSLLMAATAMGRPTIWPDNSGIAPNIKLKDANSPTGIAEALSKTLSLSVTDRSSIEKNNVITAKKFDIEKIVNALV
ncbi:MAG: glycosyltransferase [Alphaproteobacteria bacterium]|nr:glycosyltransferase [Alphaproteobacteria bacterium]